MTHSRNLRSPMRLLPAVQRTGSRLLHQQCWLFGQDIKRPDGNLLLQFGFRRLRPPEGVAGCTEYRLSLPDGTVIRLWGFGLIFSTPQAAIYLNRFEFVPRIAPLEDLWQASKLQRLPRSGEVQVAAVAAEWLAAYEQWVLHQTGLQYRQSSLGAWTESASAPQAIATEWLELARQIRRGCRVSTLPVSKVLKGGGAARTCPWQTPSPRALPMRQHGTGSAEMS